MKATYKPLAIEQQTQQFWDKNHCFEVTENLNQEKFYCLSMLPYPSGKIHMGHVRNYVIGDVIARYQRMLGKNVLQPMGWDAFGLPAENAALERKLAPSKWTRKNIKHMRDQIKPLGLALDWTRELATCDPEYYKWEQWLFLQMLERDLVYRKQSIVNWDPVDQTVLANEQVINGLGWRSGAPVEQRTIHQWFLKITAYAEELLQDLNKLTGWPEQVRIMQRNWIGRSQGIELKFKLQDSEEYLATFTTRPDTLLGVTYLAIGPKHPIAQALCKTNANIAKFVANLSTGSVAESQLATVEKHGMATGKFVIHPLNGAKIPIWIANYVLEEYGTGAVMAVPAHDQRDFEFAQKFKLPIKPVIAPKDHSSWDFTKAAHIEKGILVNSGQFDNLTSEEAFMAIGDKLTELKQGAYKTNYRLHDWGVSRQRYWGTPIPIIYCQKCGIVPVPEKDLPVILPENIKLEKPGSPLKDIPEFVNVSCPKCSHPAKRETDTFDTFMESSWYWARYCCPDQNNAMLDNRANYWTPVDQYIGGIEHAIMHLLYARFIHKVMRDLRLINADEPFTNLLTQGMLLKDGSKMSKSKGNVVAPDEIINKYGADTVRLLMIFTAPPQQSLEWSDDAIAGAYRFLKKLWTFAFQHQELLIKVNTDKLQLENPTKQQKTLRQNIHQLLSQANYDMERKQLNTLVSAAMKIFNLIQKIPTDKNQNDLIIHEGFKIILLLLAPITPHIAHTLWQELQFPGLLIDTKWPKPDLEALQAENFTMVIQINGKLRGEITVPINADKDAIEKLALADNRIKNLLADKKIKRIIVIEKKLINIVI